MKSYSTYLVKNEKDIESIRRAFWRVEFVAESPWVICGFCKDAEPPDDDVLLGETSLIRERSEEFGEVVFVYGDTSIDGFVYEHACEGKLLRKLVWFPMLDDEWSAGWVCVEGEPESWEMALFGSDNLERFIEQERVRYEDEGRIDEFGAYEQEVRAEWSSGRITAGRTYPSCDGTVALLVERSYGIERANSK